MIVSSAPTAIASRTAQSAIAVLIDLAQRGEIDPWDVQVIDVIDRFLKDLGVTESSEGVAQKADLSESGQAFLWASMLVLLKADTLERLGEEEEETEVLDFNEEDSGTSHSRSLPLRLEHHIRRRASAPPPRRRKVTLQELIEQIQEIAAEMEEPGTCARQIRSQSHRATAKAIAQLAHNENLTEMAAQLEQFFCLEMPHLAAEQRWLELDELLIHWTQTMTPRTEISNPESHGSAHDRVGVFWALLLLSAQSKVELHQEEFYQTLQIRPLGNP